MAFTASRERNRSPAACRVEADPVWIGAASRSARNRLRFPTPSFRVNDVGRQAVDFRREMWAWGLVSGLGRVRLIRHLKQNGARFGDVKRVLIRTVGILGGTFLGLVSISGLGTGYRPWEADIKPHRYSDTA